MRTNLPPRPCIDLSSTSRPDHTEDPHSATAGLSKWLDDHEMLGTNPFPFQQHATREGFEIVNEERWNKMKRYATCICQEKRFIIQRLALIATHSGSESFIDQQTSLSGHRRIKIHQIRVWDGYYCFILISWLDTVINRDSEDNPVYKMEIVNARKAVKDWEPTNDLREDVQA
ncbi:hypothetical protein K461DRAFT_330086 [Myriangium duriaei CBS 260.36]|uniref:Uncharacterized protein n=1 Tax=Myriangium duriaei CBS 260.36 TaxID=1168546 RepID=A0A9P4ISZ3_9PEZI|nr:hypothetical protein K461DRAFT_330086 [Myriangium duriaei CBS 260.36]